MPPLVHQQTPPPPRTPSMLRCGPLPLSLQKHSTCTASLSFCGRVGPRFCRSGPSGATSMLPPRPKIEMRQECKTRPLLRTCEPLAIAVPVALDRPADIFAPCAPTDARHRSRARRLQCNTRREVRETLLGAPTGRASPPSSANATKRHSQAQRWRAACALCRLRSAGASARVRSFFSS